MPLMPVETGVELAQVQQRLAQALESFRADRGRMVPEARQAATAGQPLDIVESAPHAEGGHLVQQGREAHRTVDGDHSLEQGESPLLS